jgi:uncharacterized protein YegJ (DUF2314 family)
MSESKPSRVFLFDSDDPEMQAAHEDARATFRYFWREVAWERRRIVPALDLAAVKAPFSDAEPEERTGDDPRVEQMWVGEVDFDGQAVSGVLLNAPNWLTSVQAGDPARLPLGEIADWMYVVNGEAYGAFTVNLIRSRMGRREREEHDAAWGLDFGDPKAIRLVPQKEHWFGGGKVETQEHPMSEAMAPKLREQLAKDPAMLHGTDDGGWTLLHHQALAGSAATVKVLLECGADPNAVTAHGMTPVQLARSLGWDNVVALLVKNGAAE